MKNRGRLVLSIFLGLGLFFVLVPAGVKSEPAEKAGAGDRCAVCGMMVAHYPNWLAQLRHEDGVVRWFDGVKDMLAYYFEPAQYDSPPAVPKDLWVKDYYSLNWIPGRQAFYVTGSDVLGPMGHEFIPFSSREAAESFQKDHGGDMVWSFGEITLAKVNELRSGHKMKKRHSGSHGSMPHHGGAHSSMQPGESHGGTGKTNSPQGADEHQTGGQQQHQH